MDTIGSFLFLNARRGLVGLLATGCLVAMTAAMPAAEAPTAPEAEPQWIWSAEQDAGRQVGTVFFRRPFNLKNGKSGAIQIACDDSYVLYVNGVRVGTGDSWRYPDEYDISSFLTEGRNVVAIAGVQQEQAPAGMVARLTIVTANGQSYDLSTSDQWRTSVRRFDGWEQAGFNDARWTRAKALGPVATTEPWLSLAQQEEAATPRAAAAPDSPVQSGGSPRFRVMREFRVEWLVKGEDSGSLLAMTFNEFGHILASKEGEGIILVRDSNDDGRFDKLSTYSDHVKNCQGILALNGEVYVTGDGPEGAGLYRLSDTDLDGKADKVRTLLTFENSVGEHGPHGVALGPDGLLYVVVGNLTTYDGDISPDSPYRNSYEGDLLPRYEDPTGHAAGVKAPGGHVLRTDLNGEKVEIVAGGLRNPYDIAFNSFGELYTADADMERDHGLPWYRPNRVAHLQPGGEYGWRPGWSKWPNYFIDGLPELLDMGAGSPTGLAYYEHFAFPLRHQNTLFVGDWARGQILQVTLEPQGAGYKAESRVFIEGNPLSVTDMAVGPDGALYFCSGGRGTEGGIYRAVWTGKVPPEVSDLGTGIEAALRQPQITSAWARQRIAKIKHELGDEWRSQLVRMVRDPRVDGMQRMRAIDLMQLFGPFPSQELMVEVSQDRDGQLRAKAAWLMGLHPGPAGAERLVELLEDSNPLVKRVACEALVRSNQAAPVERLLPLIASRDRSLAFAARRALEIVPQEEWQAEVLASDDIRVFLQGSVALAGMKPGKAVCRAILDRSGEWMQEFVADGDFIDLLRVQQLALAHGEITADEIPELTARIAREFPAGNAQMNRELVRLVAYLDAPGVAARYVAQLQGDIPSVEKMHLAMHAGQFTSGWTSDQKFVVMNFIRDTRNQPSGSGYADYLDKSLRDLVAGMNEQERARVIAAGGDWPEATLWSIAKLPPQPGEAMLKRLRALHTEMKGREDEASIRLRVGIVAVLARSGDANSMQFLRETFENEPGHRAVLAMGLAQQPEGENWPLLVRSLPVVEGAAALAVLNQLATADSVPEEPEPIRQVIIKAATFDERSRPAALALLEHWTGEEITGESPDDQLAGWQAWFAQKYPDQPAATLPVANETDKYTFDQLLEYLDSEQAQAADPVRGKQVFVKAQCNSCHKHGEIGDGIGPDLTSVSRRFHRKEILQSIVYPSHVISDQYASRTVITADGLSYNGLVVRGEQGDMTVLQSDGKKIRLEGGDIEQIVASNRSVMPDGALNVLTLEEIADLFAFMEQRPASEIATRPGTERQ